MEKNRREKQMSLKYSDRVVCYLRHELIADINETKEEIHPTYNKSRFIAILIEKGLKALKKENQDKES